jgi:hypothetical protein
MIDTMKAEGQAQAAQDSERAWTQVFGDGGGAAAVRGVRSKETHQVRNYFFVFLLCATQSASASLSVATFEDYAKKSVLGSKPSR